MKILAIGAHPDDIEFGCAPVLLKEVKKGTEVKLLVLSRGEAGSSGTPEQREQESRKAAELMRVAIDFWDFGGDCHIEDLRAHSFRIAGEIRRFEPSIVLAPDVDENQHPDHSAVGKMARDACRFARYGGLEELKALPVHRVANLYFYTITQHVGRRPDIVIDISEVVGDWEATMRCHETQVRSKNYLELQLSAARLLGLSIGVDCAIGLKAGDPLRLDYLSDVTLSSRCF